MITGTIGDPHDAKFLSRVVQLSDVLHLLTYDVLLVVGTNHECHLWQFVIGRDGSLGLSLQ